MHKENAQLNSLKLIGITARTNNTNEMDPEKSKIAATAGRYWSQGLANHIQNRLSPGVTYAVYTNYDSDEHGDYTYFIGEVVDTFDGQDNETFEQLTIPASQYQKFTTQSGKMPDVVISAWQTIWQMQPSDLGGQRNYIADFEVYDQRASDPNNMIVDIYIGINSI